MTTLTKTKWHAGCGNGEGAVFADEGRMKLESGGTTLTPICTVHDFDGDRDELINLISAAPEMLEVLERCADFMGSVANGGRGPSKVSATFRQAYKDARAIIAKAKGEYLPLHSF